MATEDSGYYSADEATRRLARKRQLARMLQEQSMKGMQLAAPHAQASWLNVLAPMAQAWAGKSVGEQADVEGKAEQEKTRAATKAALDEWRTGLGAEPAQPAQPATLDMAYPGLLADQAGKPQPEPAPAPFAPVAERPNTLMANLLKGQDTQSLGDKLLADQAVPTVTPEDVKTPLLPTGTKEEAPPAFVPKPVDVNAVAAASPAAAPAPAAPPPLLLGTDAEIAAEKKYGLEPGTLAMRRKLERSEKGMVSPKGAQGEHQIEPKNLAEYSRRAGRQLDPNNDADSADMAAQVAADAQRRYPDNKEAQVAYYNGGKAAGDAVAAGKETNPETTAYLKRYRTYSQEGAPAATDTQWNAMAAAAPTAGYPGEEAPPEIPPMAAPGPTPAPTLAGPAVPGAIEPPPLIMRPGSQMPDVMLPGQAAIPAKPGRTPTYLDVIDLANKLPPGHQRDQFMDEALKAIATAPDRAAQRELTAALSGQKIQSAEKIAADKNAAAEERAKARNATAERLVELRMAGGKQGYGQDYDKLTARQQAAIDWYATMQIGGDSTWRVGLSRTQGGANLIKAVDERVPTLGAELGLTAADVGTNRAVLKANQSALTHLTTDIGTIKPFAAMLDQNADILKDLSRKVIKTQSPLANKPINWLMDNAAGDPDVAEYLAQMRLVQTEAARIIQNPRLTGQLTDTAQKELEHILNGNMTLEQTEQVINRLKDDSKRRVTLMEQQRDAFTGQIKGMMTGTAPGAPAPGAPAGAPKATVDADALAVEARAAIASGRPEAAVRARYKQMTGKDL